MRGGRHAWYEGNAFFLHECDRKVLTKVGFEPRSHAMFPTFYHTTTCTSRKLLTKGKFIILKKIILFCVAVFIERSKSSLHLIFMETIKESWLAGNKGKRGLGPRSWLMLHTAVALAVLLPSATKLRQGNIFTGVCQSFCSGGVSTSVHVGIHTPWQVHPLARYTPQGRYTPKAGTPPGKYTPLPHPREAHLP